MSYYNQYWINLIEMARWKIIYILYRIILNYEYAFTIVGKFGTANFTGCFSIFILKYVIENLFFACYIQLFANIFF